MPAREKARPVSALILAAGQGKRMRSGVIKLLHAVGGAPMVCHVARAAAALKPASLVAVVGNQAAGVTAALGSAGIAGLRFVSQKQQLGTAHAVLSAERLLRASKASGDLLILNGDVPLIRAETLKALLRHHRETGAAATMLTTRVDDPAGYGRVVRDAAQNLERVVEDRDAEGEVRQIQEINAGLYCADLPHLFPALKKTGRANAQGEYYLPDIFPILRAGGERIEAYVHPDAEEVLGVNDRVELARAGKTLYRRRALELMQSGVTILDPEITYIEAGVTVGPDTVIYPLAHLRGRTHIGSSCVIGPMAHILDSTLADNVTVKDHCVISESTLAEGATIGPFSHLRPGSVLDRDVHVGNFTEIKKSRLGRGSKANHLSYLGDATIGEGCNIGAGTITCNYDGVAKHPTILEDGVFIGSDTQLVAPVRVRRGAYVGAGSTITKEVPAQALALSRTPQRNIEGWAKRKQPKQAAKRSGKRKEKH